MKRIDILLLTSLVLIYLLILFFKSPQIFSYSFDNSLIEKYMRSQDITHEVKGRIFLSDSEIHEAAGYLYIHGEDPTVYNFQHPPFIKYVYGLSIYLFNNPYFAQILFGCLLIIGTYLLGFNMFSSQKIALLSTLLLIIDPLFLDLSKNLLLDLGQTALLVIYILFFVFYPKKWLFQGITLGLLAGAKFWGGVTLFFVGILTAFILYKKQLSIRQMLLQYATAGVTFSFIYLRTFMNHNGLFNIIFFELKTLNYWLHHSTSSMLGASIIMYITSYFKTWWDPQEWQRTSVWTVLWPIGLLLNTYTGIQLLIKKKFNKNFLFCFIPILYLIYLGVQAPFSRYFIIILPFIYIMSVASLMKLIDKKSII